jgi:hypothetical protein
VLVSFSLGVEPGDGDLEALLNGGQARDSGKSAVPESLVTG